MLEYFFSFAGRFGRKEYILRSFVLGFTGICLLLILGGLSLLVSNDKVIEALRYFAGFVFFIVFTLGTMANIVRRWHDLNHSTATGAIIGLMDAVCFFAGLGNGTDVALGLSAITFIPNCLLIFKKGTVGDNEYGPDPLQKEIIEEVQDPSSGISAAPVPAHNNTVATGNGRDDNLTVDREGRIVISPNKVIAENAANKVDDRGTTPYAAETTRELLDGRQGIPVITIDDLPKLKKMLDEGVITQEEFDNAKEKILG